MRHVRRKTQVDACLSVCGVFARVCTFFFFVAWVLRYTRRHDNTNNVVHVKGKIEESNWRTPIMTWRLLRMIEALCVRVCAIERLGYLSVPVSGLLRYDRHTLLLLFSLITKHIATYSQFG